MVKTECFAAILEATEIKTQTTRLKTVGRGPTTFDHVNSQVNKFLTDEAYDFDTQIL